MTLGGLHLFDEAGYAEWKRQGELVVAGNKEAKGQWPFVFRLSPNQGTIAEFCEWCEENLSDFSYIALGTYIVEIGLADKDEAFMFRLKWHSSVAVNE